MHTILHLFFDWHAVRPYQHALFFGFLLTIRLTFYSLFFSLIGALTLALMRQAGGGRSWGGKIAKVVAVIYIDLFRGLPALLVIILLYVSLPFMSIPVVSGFSKTQVGVLALSLVYSAYMAEIFRAGIESVERGQTEAARSLGLSHLQAMRKVVLPQAVKRVIPPFLNEFIILSKDISLLSVIAVPEVIGVARDSQSETFNSTPLVVAGLYYLAFTLPLTRIVDRYIAGERRRFGGGEVRIP
ncbi:MAG: amino acid ABC transporter permease [Thermoleophilia bacterium]